MKQGIGVKIAFIIGMALVLISMPLVAACAPKPPAPTPGPPPKVEKWAKMIDLTDLTGPVSAILAPVYEGMGAYTDYINEQGGVSGVKIKWNVVDTKYDLPTAQSAYERLKEGAVLVHGYAVIMDWLVEVSPRDKIVVNSGSMTPKAAFPAQPYIYATVAWMPSITAGAIKWFKEQWKEARPPKVAVIYTDSPAGKVYTTGTAKYCRENGIDLVVLQPVPLGVTDMSAELLAIEKKFKPDLILFSMTVDGAMVGLKNRYDLGIKTPAMTIGPGDLGIVLRVLGPKPTEGVYWTAVMCTGTADELAKYPLVKTATEWWEKKHPGTPFAGAFGLGIARAMITFEALKRAVDKVGYEKLTGETLKTYGFDAMTERFDTKGLSGGWKIVPGVDHLGDKYGKVVTCREGKLVILKDWSESPPIAPPFD